MTILKEEAIKAANLTSYGRPKGDLIEKEVGRLLADIDASGVDNAEELKADIVSTANAHLMAEGSYVPASVAGRSSYKKDGRAVNRATETGTRYAQAIGRAKNAIAAKAKEAADIEKHGSVENAERVRKIKALTQEAILLSCINKTLCYKTLMEIYELDPISFVPAYSMIDRNVGISKRSKVAKLYKEMTEE